MRKMVVFRTTVPIWCQRGLQHNGGESAHQPHTCNSFCIPPFVHAVQATFFGSFGLQRDNCSPFFGRSCLIFSGAGGADGRNR